MSLKDVHNHQFKDPYTLHLKTYNKPSHLHLGKRQNLHTLRQPVAALLSSTAKEKKYRETFLWTKMATLHCFTVQIGWLRYWNLAWEDQRTYIFGAETQPAKLRCHSRSWSIRTDCHCTGFGLPPTASGKDSLRRHLRHVHYGQRPPLCTSELHVASKSLLK